MIKTFTCRFANTEAAEMAAYNIRRNLGGIQNISIIPSAKRVQKGAISYPIGIYAAADTPTSADYEGSVMLTSYAGNIVAAPDALPEPYRKTDAVLQISCEDSMERKIQNKLINLGAIEITEK